ncbi:MAG: hypothetical protein NTU43_08170 [Bacteroidetes bacterium]|nr:hypothetical protein [Bacteroidota bacterium]
MSENLSMDYLLQKAKDEFPVGTRFTFGSNVSRGYQVVKDDYSYKGKSIFVTTKCYNKVEKTYLFDNGEWGAVYRIGKTEKEIRELLDYAKKIYPFGTHFMNVDEDNEDPEVTEYLNGFIVTKSKYIYDPINETICVPVRCVLCSSEIRERHEESNWYDLTVTQQNKYIDEERGALSHYNEPIYKYSKWMAIATEATDIDKTNEDNIGNLFKFYKTICEVKENISPREKLNEFIPLSVIQNKYIQMLSRKDNSIKYWYIDWLREILMLGKMVINENDRVVLLKDS